MRLLESLRKVFGRPAASSGTASAPHRPAREPEAVPVPEVTPSELMAELRNGNGHKPFLLDCREHFERRQGHIPDDLHIPMNHIPFRLAELEGVNDIVVYCAHGHRSYDVTGWLIRQGFTARSLKGGFVAWQLSGGELRRER